MPQTSSLIRTLCLSSLVLVAGIFIGYSIPKTTPHNTDSSEAQATLSNTPTTKESRTNVDAEQEGTNALTPEALQALSFDQKAARIERLKEVNTIDGTIEMLSLLTTMSEGELQHLLADASKDGMGSMSDFFVPFYIFQAWVDKNPESAFSFYQNESNPMQKRMFAQSLFAAWGSRDADGALAAAQAIEEKSERNQAIAAIAMSVAGKDPEAAYNIIMAQRQYGAIPTLDRLHAVGRPRCQCGNGKDRDDGDRPKPHACTLRPH